MNQHIPKRQLIEACKMAADMLGVSPAEFKEAVFEFQREEYDRIEIRDWLESQECEYTESDVTEILDYLKENYNPNLDAWGNIAAARCATHGDE